MTALARREALEWRDLVPGRRQPPAGLLDLPGCLPTTSGRAAIWLALGTLGLAAGDRVLMPSFHCPSMLAPLRSRGVEPVFYPLGPAGEPRLDTLDAAALAGVRALLAVHWFGRPQPMAALRAWCDARGLALIEDCAHAFWGQVEGRPVGRWGDLAIGSLTKFMPVSEGGCLVPNRPGLAVPPLRPAGPKHLLRTAWRMLEGGARAGRLAGLGWAAGRSAAAPRGDEADVRPWVDLERDGEARLDTRLAGQALSAPCRWVARQHRAGRATAARRAQWAAYAQGFAGRPGLRPLWPALQPDEVPYVFPLWVDVPDPGYAALRRAGMPLWRWDRAWPGTPDLPDDTGRLWSRHVIQLACHPQLDGPQTRRIVDAVRHTYGA